MLSELLRGSLKSRDSQRRSLQAALTWSVEALEDQDREGLMLLSVFSGTWDLPAARAVLQVVDAGPVLKRLAASFLVVEEGEGEYRLLTSVRRWLLTQVPAREASIAADRHARHYLQQALIFAGGAMEAGFVGNRLPMPYSENFNVALRWFSTHPDCAAEFYSGVVALTFYWVSHGRWHEGRAWAREASERSSKELISRHIQARLNLGEAVLLAYGEDAVAASEAAGRAIELLDSDGDRQAIGLAQWTLGFSLYLRGLYADAALTLEAALECFNQGERGWWAAVTLHIQGFVACGQGRHDEAQVYFDRSIELWSKLGLDYVTYASRLGLGRVAWLRGDFQNSLRIYGSCLEAYVKAGDYRMGMYAMEGQARAACSGKDLPRAARLFGAAERIRDDYLLNLDATDQPLHDSAIQECRQALGQGFESEFAVGKSQPWGSYPLP